MCLRIFSKDTSFITKDEIIQDVLSDILKEAGNNVKDIWYGKNSQAIIDIFDAGLTSLAQHGPRLD